jgi:hypothetical protein
MNPRPRILHSTQASLFLLLVALICAETLRAQTPTPARPMNMSTRAQIPAGDTAIAGFIICGTAPKHLVLRALGPSLASHGVTNALPDPTLELQNSKGEKLIVNDDWKDDIAQRYAIEQADQMAPPDDKESAIDVIVDPGAYTAIVRGKAKDSGLALLEVYDFEPGGESKLSNISTRALVGTENNIVIAGFILGNNDGPDQLVLRGMGPSTALTGALQDPQLEVRRQWKPGRNE